MDESISMPLPKQNKPLKTEIQQYKFSLANRKQVNGSLFVKYHCDECKTDRQTGLCDKPIFPMSVYQFESLNGFRGVGSDAECKINRIINQNNHKIGMRMKESITSQNTF